MKGEPLARAAAAGERGDLEAALDGLLEAWRAQPIAELAERIERVSARVATTPPTAATWTAIAHKKKPAALGPLLATLFDGTVKVAIERIERLADWPADPRLDMFLAETFAKVPYRSTSARPFWVRLMRRQPLLEDARVLPILERCRAGYGTDYAERYLDELIVRLLRERPRLEDNQKRSLPASWKPLLARLDATLGAVAADDPESVESLLERVLEHPDDDEARQVLGDALSQAGDVRGELLALQYQSERGPLTTAQRRREAKIVAEHFLALVGPLAQVVLKKEAVFRRGFLSACVVKTTNPQHVSAVASSPWWATVEHLEGPSRIFFQPVMRSLRSLSMCIVDSGSGTRESIAELCKRGLPRLEQLQCAVDDEDTSRADLDALLKTKALPALRALSIRIEPDEVPRLFESALVRRLEHLRIRLPVGPSPRLVGPLDPLRWRARAEALGLRSFEMDVGSRTLRHFTRFTFVLDDKNKLSRVTTSPGVFR